MSIVHLYHIRRVIDGPIGLSSLVGHVGKFVDYRHGERPWVLEIEGRRLAFRDDEIEPLSNRLYPFPNHNVAVAEVVKG